MDPMGYIYIHMYDMFFVTADIAGGTASLAVAKRAGGSMHRPLVRAEFPHGSAEKAEVITHRIHVCYIW